jgi:peptidoglycan/xylan/chitin deacetylase (PgdA/CDA1 family)
LGRRSDGTDLSVKELMRLDKQATLFYRKVLSDNALKDRGYEIPILMYHSVIDELRVKKNSYFSIETSTKIFDLHMRILNETGYRVVTIKDAVSILSTGESIHEPLAVITFDDGYMDFLLNAFPIMAQYNFTAEVFLPTDYINRNGGTFNGRPCLNWSDVQALAKKGVCFGSHSCSHRKLDTLSNKELTNELLRSKKTIEDKLGFEVLSFSYPYSFPEGKQDFVQMLEKELRKAGYQYGLTTRIGRVRSNHNPLFLSRLPINEFDGQDLFSAKLEGYYDWMKLPQILWKRVPCRKS